MNALTTGILVAGADGCVGLRRPADAKPILLRWPAGTTLSQGGQGVVGESGKTFSFGQEVGFGGGFGAVPVPAECDASAWGGVFDIQQPL